MVEMIILLVVALPITIALVRAYFDSKDYFEYDEEHSRYVSRVLK